MAGRILLSGLELQALRYDPPSFGHKGKENWACTDAKALLNMIILFIQLFM